MSAFNRGVIIEDLADRLWRYLSPSAASSTGGKPQGVGTLMLESDLEDLIHGHLALSTKAGAMLEEAERIAERLPSVSTRRSVELDGEVEGEVDWFRTSERRHETGERGLFVCTPVRRAYESLHARVLKSALLAYERVALASPFTGGDGHTIVESRLHEAQSVLRKAKLGGVRPLAEPSNDQLDKVGRRYGMRVVTDYLREHLEATNSRGIERATELFTDVLLAPSTNDRLFELKVGFDLVDGLRTAGLELRRLQALPGSRYPFAELVGFGCEIDVWSQRSLGAISGLSLGESRYAMTRTANGLGRSSLVPDFVLVSRGNLRRVLLVEVKLSESRKPSLAHVSRGITDAFANLYDYPELEAEPNPKVAVVAWDAPTIQSERPAVHVCSQNGTAEVGAMIAQEVRESAPDTVPEAG